ncbi:MAG: hypothetical protein ACP5PX_07290 [Candidatus Hadarchaeum sp.]|uniref:hypothetical protein n=1 Tax=Candidatus Hadarchaeum sp. TaxID=2883567 RepID=UPI003D11BF44
MPKKRSEKCTVYCDCYVAGVCPFGAGGKCDFSQPWAVVRRLVVAWVAVVLVSIPFDMVIHALEGAQRRRKTGEKANKGSEGPGTSPM